MASKRKAKRSRARSMPVPVDISIGTMQSIRPPVVLKNEDELRAFLGPEDKKAGALDSIRDTIVMHRVSAQTIRKRLGELSMRLFGESPPHGQVGDADVPSSMLARIRDEADELGTVLAGASDILDKLETL